MPAKDQRQTEGTRAPDHGDDRVAAYLNHGIESLVSMDNPDDSQLGADRIPGQKEGATDAVRRG